MNPDDITIDLSDYTNTITIDTSTMMNGVYTSTKISEWVTTNITLEPVLWEDHLPDPDTVKKMCEQYPALAKAYENFKTIYVLVEQDWKGNHDDQDELSF
jgi:hypothetical protein